MSDIAKEFPDYPVASLPEIPAGFVPSHWHNDACPSWSRGDLVLFIDYPNPADRDFDDGTRFSLQRSTGAGANVIVDTDDWTTVLAFIAAEPMPRIITSVQVMKIDGVWQFSAWVGDEFDHSGPIGIADDASEDDARAAIGEMFSGPVAVERLLLSTDGDAA